jgi:hypothetical protein
MHWKEYRLARTRVATGEADGARRVLELFDGRVLIERDGAPAQIVTVDFEEAKAQALALARVAVVRLPWWKRLYRALFGGAS